MSDARTPKGIDPRGPRFAASITTVLLAVATLLALTGTSTAKATTTIAERAADPKRRQGLIWHHQGSGKTLLAAFACGKLRRAVPGSTVIVLLDRLDLIEQTGREFESAGVEVIPAPTDFALNGLDLRAVLAWIPDAGALRGTSAALKEYLGVLVARLRGQIDGSVR